MTTQEFARIVQILSQFIEQPSGHQSEAIKTTASALKHPRTWRNGTKGKIPGWVKTMTGLSENRALRVAYGPNTEFVEGQEAPPKL